MNSEEVINKITSQTRAVFLTHAQGFNGLTKKLLIELEKKEILLIEDVCESHGSVFEGKKNGNHGWLSNFSFYYAHHMSTIEGGMICTNDEETYQQLRIYRSHGMLRESNSTSFKEKSMEFIDKELNKEFIFMYPSFNMRNNEIGAVLGLNQLTRLDTNIKKRNENHQIFINLINKENFFTDFNIDGLSNYAFNLICREKDDEFFARLSKELENQKIEYRRGSAGGGNQLRQPYIKKYLKNNEHLKYLNTEHIHFYGMYLGNFPDLKREEIEFICKIINSV